MLKGLIKISFPSLKSTHIKKSGWSKITVTFNCKLPLNIDNNGNGNCYFFQKNIYLLPLLYKPANNGNGNR